MKTTSITYTKNNLSALLEEVRKGEIIVILDRNIPVARIEAINHDHLSDGDGLLMQLEKSGLLLRGRHTAGPEDIGNPPRPIIDIAVSQVLVADRGESR